MQMKMRLKSHKKGTDLMKFLSIFKHPKENESLGLPGNEILEKVKLFYRQKGGGSFSI